ncbi:unnamed protein product, partial [Polarella glacialis]
FQEVPGSVPPLALLLVVLFLLLLLLVLFLLLLLLLLLLLPLLLYPRSLASPRRLRGTGPAYGGQQLTMTIEPPAESNTMALQNSTAEGSSEYIEGRLLDGFLLLAAGGSNSPDEVVTVNLSSLNIVDVAEEDLAFFGHLDRLDVSDNQLGYEHVLEQLSRVPKLSTLNLACNSISSLQVPANIFRHLEALDLSFNGLHGDVLSQLARLSSLITLNLSSNCISSVPPEEELLGLQ